MIRKEKTYSIYTQLANKYNIPARVVEVICNHPFKFANSRIADCNDIKPIMFAYLFKLKPKRKIIEEYEANKI